MAAATIREPEMDYEVREDGIWIPVDHGKASQCDGGYLLIEILAEDALLDEGGQA